VTDVELTRALERQQVPNAGFHHVDHLRVALVYLNESASIDDAIGRMASTLRRFAASVGQAQKYSQATTEFWMYQMAAVRALMPGADFEAIVQACPRLLDKNLMVGYCSHDGAATRSADPPRDPSRRPVPR
jgi:hypothetical protein